MPPGIYANKDTSEVVYTIGYHEGALQVTYDDKSMKTKLILTRFGGTFGTLKFNEKSFFILYWVLHRIRITDLLRQFKLIAQAFLLVIKI